ncbi:helix-turn-helix domain-containing protein [Paenibacillus thermoaerophilus]|uniref:Helix-turn-helix domain-containing protein n=1 Tax=Paenibacillus thermoaerophilus TaxID=1215385 RepID=A0ABW2V4L5_9BACL|nr:helix-turn-helix domain-containing protein [Paenibacillus thermoaerophilus]TMV07343.1 helix-turn-helix domain-containing protein [Paenibacillus thermoaerophilus]
MNAEWPAVKGPVASQPNSGPNLDEVKAFMDRHYHEPLTTGQLAEMAGLSPKYFAHLFKKTYGQSAVEYLTDLRINRAKRYLAESGARLREIALQVGYSDEFYFSHKFKKEVGVSPSDYKKQARSRVAACSPPITGHLLALDVVPAAAPLDPKWTAYYYNDYRTAIKFHLKLTEPYSHLKFDANIGMLSRIRPDAIIGTDRLSADERAKLTEIAPSLFIPESEDGWRDQLRKIAHFLNREEAAERWIQRYERQAEFVRERIGKVLGGERILVLRIYGSRLHVYWNRGLEDVLRRDLRLEAADRGGSSVRNTPITLEQLRELNPDRMLLAVCPDTASRTYWLALQHSSAWWQLKAVRKRRVYPIPSDPWFEYSAVAVSRILDEALLLFTGKSTKALPH